MPSCFIICGGVCYMAVDVGSGYIIGGNFLYSGDRC
jgi:hypothetical protein